MTFRTYTELSRLHGLENRFEYLSLQGIIGETTFGFERHLNQKFYRSVEWKQVRTHVIVRDEGFDLGDRETPIRGAPLIHHMNPITMSDIEEGTENLLDPEFLITTSHRTHNAIHYGDKSLLPQAFVERTPGDTLQWGRG